MWVTFGFPGGVWQIARCSMQLFRFTLSRLKQRCQAFAWLSNLESCKLKEVSGWQTGSRSERGAAFHQLFSHILSSFCPCLRSNCSFISDYWDAGRCEGPFLFPAHTPDCAPMESSMSIKTSIGWLRSFWQTAESKVPQKSERRSCVFISVSLSRANTNSLLNSTALLAFHFPFGKLD